jgi:hypothetical protein
MLYQVKLPINFDGYRYGVKFFKGIGETSDKYIANVCEGKGFEVTEIEEEKAEDKTDNDKDENKQEDKTDSDDTNKDNEIDEVKEPSTNTVAGKGKKK